MQILLFISGRDSQGSPIVRITFLHEHFGIKWSFLETTNPTTIRQATVVFETLPMDTGNMHRSCSNMIPESVCCSAYSTALLKKK